jgi:hypothetical protein
MTEIIRYLLHFLLGENVPDEIVNQIGYTSDAGSFHLYKAVIIPSGFWGETVYGTMDSMPALPLQQVDGIPLLFGTPQVEQSGETLLIHADLVAGSFFLLSRYEEIIRRDVRDPHGRFPGRESLPFRAGFIHRPIVDEYGRLLRKWLSQTGIQLPEPPRTIRHINLTHDVDAPFAYRSWRSVARGIVLEKKNPWNVLRTRLGALENDPFYTFPWLLNEDLQLKEQFEGHCDILLFFRAGGRGKEDKPHYSLRGKDVRKLYALTVAHQGKAGLHSSYQAGKDPALISNEKSRLEKAFCRTVCANRHHFLASREPEDMSFLEQTGITDDFTVGYADVAGFRLGTAPPVRWIDASSQSLSSLILHPLTIMDCTLSEARYMELSFLEAQDYCLRLIEQVRQFNGELTLLWHNTMVVEGEGYLKTLYHNLLQTL